MSELVLRPMVAEDIDAVVAIERAIHRFPWTLGNFSDALDSGYLCKVAELDGAIAGYAVMMSALDEIELLDIGIVAEYQGKGLGSELLQRMMELARSINMRRMFLEVRPSNVAALALYSKHGFREIGLRRGYYAAGDEREDAIVMERIL
jgi:[ribosomal protein S18]-alanine N-acetyltransferase